MSDISFRIAEKKDCAKVLYFIKELAKYEKMLDEVEATEELIGKWIFDKKKAEVVFPVVDGKEIGIAIFFHNFSTFVGKAGLYVEDVYIMPEYRGKGYGKKIFSYLASIAVERDCGRMEWTCLDWNEPSINFYKAHGAVPMDEWTVYRLTKKEIVQLAEDK